MVAFSVYAVAVWYAAAKWRRQWGAFACIVLGAAGLVLLGYFHWKLNIWTHGRIYFRVLQTLLYPYSALVVSMGLFLACLPRAKLEVHCEQCQYSLCGLEGEATLCPECGTPHALWPALSPAAAATPARPAAPAPAIPRWPPIAAQAVCRHQADG